MCASSWDFVCALLVDNSWIEEQLAIEQKESAASSKLLDMEQGKITQIKAKIAKVHDGFEAGIYSTHEAKTRIGNYQSAIAKAEKEIERLRQNTDRVLNSDDINTLCKELKNLAAKNLEEATFEEKRDLISKLDLLIYPSEDLKTMRVRCGLSLTWQDDTRDGTVQCGKIIFAPLLAISAP